MTDTTPLFRRGRRRLGRFLAWAALLPLLAFGGAVVYLYYVPIASSRLRDRLEKQFGRASGVPVTFAQGKLFAAERRYEIRDLTFYADTKKRNPALEVKQVDVTVSLLGLLLGRESYINSVSIIEPSPLELIYDQKGIEPGPKAARLKQVLQKLQPRQKSSGTFPFKSLKVVDARVNLYEKPANAGDLTQADLRETSPSITFGLSELRAGTNEEGLLISEFAGLLDAGRSESPVQGKFVAKRGASIDLALQFPAAQVSQMFSAMPATNVEAKNLSLRMSIARAADGFRGSGEIAADSYDATAPDTHLRLHDDAIRVNLDASYSTQTATLAIETAAVTSKMADAVVSGSVVLNKLRNYDLKISATKLGAPYRALIARLLPEGWQIEAKDDSFEADASVSGSGGKLSALVGKLLFTSVTLSSAQFQKPLTGFTGEIDFEPERLVFHELTGNYGRTNMRLTGNLGGNYVRDREGKLDLNWEASATADDVMSLLGQSGADRKTRFSPGTISSHGRLEQFISLKQPVSSDLPHLTGEIRLTKVGFTHPELPAPITGLTGLLKIAGNQVTVDSLHGDMDGNEVHISGLVAGNRYFWRTPQLTATVSLKMDLEKVVGFLPPEIRKSAEKFGIAGEAESQLKITANMGNLQQSDFTGRILLHNAAFDPGFEFMTGSLSDVEADLNWDGDALRLNSFRTKLNGETIEGSGLLSPDEIYLDLRGGLDLASITKTFPASAKWFDVAGPGQYKLRFSVGDVATPAVEPGYEDAFGGRLVPLIVLVNKRINQAVETRKFKMNGEVTFGNNKQGARIRHNGMPTAREDDEGRKIPRGELLNVHARATVSGDTFSISKSDPARCDFADTKDCRVYGTLKYRPDDLPKMDFTLAVNGEARLDSWILGWGQGLERPPNPPKTSKSFDLTAHISAPRAVYKGLPAGSVRTTIVYQLTQDKPRVTRFSDVQIQGADGGSVSASGTINSFPWDSDNYPHWTAEGTMNRMRMLPVLVWIFKDVSNIDGVATGHIQVEGVGTDSNRIRGNGDADLNNLTIGKTVLMQRLGQTAKQSFESRTFGTVQAANFQIANGAISSRDVQLESKGMLLQMRGTYYYSGSRARGIAPKTIDATMRIKLLESLTAPLRALPLIPDLLKIPDALLGTLFLNFQVSGTADDPRVSPVVLPIMQGTETLGTPSRNQ